ncbi:MAG: hypothetical protein AB1472_02195 [Candidatus Omnitrophota bacterium]
MITKIKIIFLITYFCAINTYVLAQEIEPLCVDSSRLKQTDITSYLDNKIIQGKNLIYCSTFQIAWNELMDSIIKEPIKLDAYPFAAQELNKKLTIKKDLSDDCYLAMAGFNKDGIIEKIKKALRDKFNTTMGINVNLKNPDDILAYAFLFKNLKFENEFEVMEEPIKFKSNPMFDGTNVKAFGIKNYKPGNTYDKIVNLLDYQNEDDFIISLKSIVDKDEIILAKVSPKDSLIKTIEYVLSRINNKNASSLKEGETLQIPKIDFNIFHEFFDLENRSLLNKGWEQYILSKAIQAIRFRLDEKGAFLRSEAVIELEEGIMDYSPRQFIFNKAFLICLKEKNAKYPYLAIWIDNVELLIKQEATPGDSSYSLGTSGFGILNQQDSTSKF